jgi:hypothetical protein
MTFIYIPDKQILEACPSCQSGRIACVVGLDLDFCMECYRVWERLRDDEPYTIDGEQMAFHVPCDNCAFRGGSQERADPQIWAELQSMLANGGAFYCHKGVPFSMDTSKPGAVMRGFGFPRKPGSVTIEGKSHGYEQYDTQHMRLCRGYLNAHIGPLLKADRVTTT